MATITENLNDLSAPGLPVPDGVKLTAPSIDAWRRIAIALPLETGPRLLFVIVDAPLLRERLASYLAASFAGFGFPVNTVRLDPLSGNPVAALFESIGREPEARAHFIMGLDEALYSPDHVERVLMALSMGRNRIPVVAKAPLVFWVDSPAFKILANGSPAFMQWRGGEFRLDEDEGPMAEAKARYRQHVIDRFSKLTLYSVTSDKPLAVDLERIFVKLTATERRQLSQFGAGGGTVRPARYWAPEDLNPGRGVWMEGGLPAELVERGVTQDEARERRVTLNEALAAHSELAIIGAPGSGKTTLLKYIALSYARRQAKRRLGLDEDRLPVLITLRDFHQFVQSFDPGGQSAGGLNPRNLPAALAWFHSRHFPSLPLPDCFFAALLEHGEGVVLMDGLDEIADSPRREGTAQFAGSCAATYAGNRFVVTSRPRGYEAGRRYLANTFNECTIQDFDHEQIAGFVKSWYLAVTIDREGDNPTARDTAANSAEDLLNALKSDRSHGPDTGSGGDRVSSLATNPLLLSILALIHQRGNRLPQRRVALYEECIEFLLGFWHQVKGGEAARELARIGGLTSTEKRTVIEPVALWLHQRGEKGAEVSGVELKQQLALRFQELYGDEPAAALRRAAAFVNIIVEHA
ncbi:MAG TPA: NACHT domain-containing protein, partial [Blastocatellia bacterium]|nr:NACHT domain-containing protein [Blastocatellia bacterium]